MPGIEPATSLLVLFITMKTFGLESWIARLHIIAWFEGNRPDVRGHVVSSLDTRWSAPDQAVDSTGQAAGDCSVNKTVINIYRKTFRQWRYIYIHLPHIQGHLSFQEGAAFPSIILQILQKTPSIY